MTKKRKKGGFVAGIVILLLLAVAFFILPFVLPNYAYDNTNTVEMSATFQRIEKIDKYNSKNGKTVKGYYIYTNEYACPLLINDGLISSDTDFGLLSNDVTIHFRINSLAVDIAGYDTPFDRPGVKQVAILSLRAGINDIFTLEDSNKKLLKEVITGKIICCTASACFLTGAIVLLVFFVKKSKK